MMIINCDIYNIILLWLSLLKRTGKNPFTSKKKKKKGNPTPSHFLHLDLSSLDFSCSVPSGSFNSHFNYLLLFWRYWRQFCFLSGKHQVPTGFLRDGDCSGCVPLSPLEAATTFLWGRPADGTGHRRSVFAPVCVSGGLAHGAHEGEEEAGASHCVWKGELGWGCEKGTRSENEWALSQPATTATLSRPRLSALGDMAGDCPRFTAIYE